MKTIPKVNYYKKEFNSKEMENRGNEIIENEYFECSKSVCSFSCMMSKGKELAQKDFRFFNYKSLIIQMYHIIFGIIHLKYPESPSPDILEEYGGEFT